MKSEKGVTLLSLLTYIAILLTIMMIIGRITGVFQNDLENVDTENRASSDYSLLNYSILSEVKKQNVIAELGTMIINEQEYTFQKNENQASGTAIKFGDGNIISNINNKIYFNKTKIVDNVNEFSIDYIKSTESNKKDSIKISIKIDNNSYEQEYTFR